jgi:hypothetical protein
VSTGGRGQWPEFHGLGSYSASEYWSCRLHKDQVHTKTFMTGCAMAADISGPATAFHPPSLSMALPSRRTNTETNKEEKYCSDNESEQT